MIDLIGSPSRARTYDLRINSPSLYQLSYRGIWVSVFEALMLSFWAFVVNQTGEQNEAITDEMA